MALKIEAERPFDSRGLMNTLWAAVMKLYGEYGASRVGMSMIDYDAEKGFVIIRAALEAVDMVRTALASIMNVDGQPATIHVLSISGTIKALHERMSGCFTR